MTQKTILNDTHRALGAKMVDFGGWDMPIHYGSQIDEHHLVRRDAGMFDVSHMTVVDLHGAQRARLPAPAGRQLGRQAQGAGQGAVHLHAQPAGRRDRRPDRLFPCARTSSAWWSMPPRATRTWRGSPSRPRPSTCRSRERPDFGMIAVQGPNAREKVLGLLREEDRAAHRQARQVRRRRGDDDGRRRRVRRAHRLHRRGRLRDHRAGRRRPSRSGTRCCRRREAGGPGRARHAAPGSRHGPLRPGHGRHRVAVRSRRWPGRSRSTRAATSSAAACWKRRRPPACRAR